MSWNAMLMALAVVAADPQLGDEETFLEVSEADAERIRMVIRAQLAAFRSGNAERAYALSTADIQARAGNAERFLAGVLEEARTLAQPRQLFFGELVLTPDGLAQSVDLVGRDGARSAAMYLMERDGAGEWRVGGCVIGAQPEALMAA